MSQIIHRQITLELEERKEGTPSTFSAVLSTETPVRRSLWGEVVNEVLRHDEKSIDLSRARPSLPLIVCHEQRELPVGVIEGIRLDGRKLRGTVRFGQSQRSQDVARDVADGILTGISIGYSIEKFEDKTNRDGSTTRTATRWTPHEASAVAIPADIAAGFGRGATMEEETTTTENTNPVEQVRAQELERCREIRGLCTRGKLGDQFADELITSGASIDAARAKILERYISSNETPSFGPNISATGRDLTERPLLTASASHVRHNVTDRRSEIIEDVALGRMNSIELARTIVLQSGGELPRNNHALVKRALSTSDFPLILTGAVGASLRRGYENEPASHREWVRVEPVQDFKLQQRPILGAAPDLKLKLEAGEYEFGALDEDGTSYKIATYGRIVKLTREVLVNDALSAWLRLLPAMGQACRRKEADLVYSLFAENSGDGPTMQDGNPLFDAAHKNVIGPGSFGVNLLAQGRILLRKQTGVGGGLLALRPATLIVPAEEEHGAELLLAAASRVVSSTLESDVTPWIKDLKMVVEPRLPNTAAYLVADNEQIDSAVLGLLDGEMGPYFEEENEFSTDNKSFKVRQDMGAKFLDWRGIVQMQFGG